MCIILYLLLYQYSHLIHLKGHFLQLFSGKCSFYISSDSHLNKHRCIKSILWIMKTDLNLMGKKQCFWVSKQLAIGIVRLDIALHNNITSNEFWGLLCLKVFCQFLEAFKSFESASSWEQNKIIFSCPKHSMKLLIFFKWPNVRWEVFWTRSLLTWKKFTWCNY